MRSLVPVLFATCTAATFAAGSAVDAMVGADSLRLAIHGAAASRAKLVFRDRHLARVEVDVDSTIWTWNGFFPVLDFENLREMGDSIKLASQGPGVNMVPLRDRIDIAVGVDPGYGWFLINDTVVDLRSVDSSAKGASAKTVAAASATDTAARKGDVKDSRDNAAATSPASDTVEMRVPNSGSASATLALKRGTGLNLTNIRLYSDVVGFFGQKKTSLLQVDARLDIPVRSEFKGRSASQENALEWLPRLSPYVYFPSIIGSTGGLDSARRSNPINLYREAVTRAGIDFNLVALLEQDRKSRLDVMVGFISDQFAGADSTSSSTYSCGIEVFPYLREVFYLDGSLSADFRAGMAYLWFEETGRQSLANMSMTFEAKNPGAGFPGSLFVRCGLLFDPVRITPSTTPSLQVGYQFKTGIVDKLVALVK
jgi:hypothetical protein